MKIKKMAGALALTAALAMGSVPAFAASVSNDVNEFDNSSDGSTEIKATIKAELNKQIKATVPMQVVVAFSSDTGSKDIIGPNKSAYKITNTGENAIQVADVKIDPNNTFFTYDLITEVDNEWYAPNVDTGNTIDSGNYLMFTYKTEKNNSFLTPAHPLKDSKAKQGMNDNDTKFYADAVTFNAEQIAKDSALEIDFGGKAFFTDQIASTNVTDALCNVLYTIEAAE